MTLAGRAVDGLLELVDIVRDRGVLGTEGAVLAVGGAAAVFTVGVGFVINVAEPGARRRAARFSRGGCILVSCKLLT